MPDQQRIDPAGTGPLLYLGAHQPHWLWRAGFPLFVSYRQLARRPGRRLRPGSCRWALDSGGFTELSSRGRWTIPAAVYAAAVRRYRDHIGGLDWAAIQDWPCEPVMLEGGRLGGLSFAGTGLTVAEHQRRTVASYLELTALAPELPWIPVLQGWRLPDYLTCIEHYAAAGVDLAALPLVGLGSVCRRQSTAEIGGIAAALAGRGLRLHGFGVKTLGLRRYGHHLVSADSMAWSYAARRGPALPSCHGHRNCANCLRYATGWRNALLTQMAADRRADRQGELFPPPCPPPLDHPAPRR